MGKYLVVAHSTIAEEDALDIVSGLSNAVDLAREVVELCVGGSAEVYEICLVKRVVQKSTVEVEDAEEAGGG